MLVFIFLILQKLDIFIEECFHLLSYVSASLVQGIFIVIDNTISESILTYFFSACLLIVYRKVNSCRLILCPFTLLVC